MDELDELEPHDFDPEDHGSRICSCGRLDDDFAHWVYIEEECGACHVVAEIRLALVGHELISTCPMCNHTARADQPNSSEWWFDADRRLFTRAPA